MRLEIGGEIMKVDPNPFPIFDRRIEPTGIRWLLWVCAGRPESWVTIKKPTSLPGFTEEEKMAWVENELINVKRRNVLSVIDECNDLGDELRKQRNVRPRN